MRNADATSEGLSGVLGPDITVFVVTDFGLIAATPYGEYGQSEVGYFPTGLLGPYGTLYALSNGEIYAEGPYQSAWDVAGQDPWQAVATNVRQLLEDSNGILYALGYDGKLYLGYPGVGAAGADFELAPKTVTSMVLDPSGSGVDVTDQFGQYWHYDGSTWTLLSVPHLTVTVNGVAAGQPITVTAGQPLTVLATVVNPFNQPATLPLGSLEFASSDPAAAPDPASVDQATATFTYTLVTAGTQVMTIGSTDSAIAPVAVAVTVNAGPAATLGIDPVSVVAGDALAVTVAAYDGYGNVASSFAQTVTFSSSDPKAVLPASYTFSSGGTDADNGLHTFLVPLYTAGGHTLSVSSPSISGVTGVVVLPAAPDPTQSSLSAPATSVMVGGVLTVTLTVRDAYGNLATAPVTPLFALAAGSDGGDFGTPTSLGNGVYTITFAPTAAGSDAIVGEINGVPLTSPAVTLTVPTSPTGTIATDLSTFAWPAVAGATSYTLAVTDNLTKNQVLSLTHLPAAYDTLTARQALTPGHSYSWTAEGVSASGKATVAKSGVSFAVARLGTPTPVGPSGPTATDMPTFTWTAVADAVHTSASSFTITVTDKATHRVLTIAGLTGTSYTLTAKQALTPGHSYTWSVTAVSRNGQASAASTAASNPTFTVGPMAAPALNGPTGSANTDMPTFTWTVLSSSTDTAPASYTLKLTDKATRNVTTISKIASTTYTLTAAQALTPGHVYTWSVSAVSTNGLAQSQAAPPAPH